MNERARRRKKKLVREKTSRKEEKDEQGITGLRSAGITLKEGIES